MLSKSGTDRRRQANPLIHGRLISCPRCGTTLEPAAPPQGAQYTCPMHPEVVASEPGRCPKCGMPLELRTAPAEQHAGHDHTMPKGN
ncbi:MAG: heavy metal-binding domain-containing protein [Sulfuricaulis sp.]